MKELCMQIFELPYIIVKILDFYALNTLTSKQNDITTHDII